MAKSITPLFEVFNYVVEDMLRDADRLDDANARETAHAIRWFFATSRTFTGAHRAISHMSRPTMRAFLRRVLRGMKSAAKLRGSKFVVTGDLNNTIIAHALGLTPETAEAATCNHPYGTPFTIKGR